MLPLKYMQCYLQSYFPPRLLVFYTGLITSQPRILAGTERARRPPRIWVNITYTHHHAHADSLVPQDVAVSQPQTAIC